VEAGAELREGFTVEELLSGDRVTGIRGQGKGGQPVIETAPIVIGADGLHSLVARTVQAPHYHEQHTLTCAYFSYFSGLPVEGATIYARERRFLGAFPTNNGRTCVALQLPIEDLDAFRIDIAGHFFQTLELVPELADRVRAAQREERFLGATDMPNFFRKPYGPGWALVGDAGYHKDPYTAQGIADAFLGAELLSEALDAGWSGRRDLAAALADYEQQRNMDALPKFELNCQLASLEPPPPEMHRLFGALVTNPVERAHSFGTIVGTVSIPEFFAPANLQRILTESGPGEVAFPDLSRSFCAESPCFTSPVGLAKRWPSALQGEWLSREDFGAGRRARWHCPLAAPEKERYALWENDLKGILHLVEA